MRKRTGHIISHLVYKVFSSCWQHLEGQQPGQVQQQQRHVHMVRLRISPMTKGTT